MSEGEREERKQGREPWSEFAVGGKEEWIATLAEATM